MELGVASYLEADLSEQKTSATLFTVCQVSEGGSRAAKIQGTHRTQTQEETSNL